MSVGQATALSWEMERIQFITFPRITSSPSRCPRKHPISTSLPLTRQHQPAVLRWQPPQCVWHPCACHRALAWDPFQPRARSQILASMMLSCHDTSPILFSLPSYGSETLMHSQLPQDLQDRYPAQFHPLIAQTCANICFGQGTFPAVGTGAHLRVIQKFRCPTHTSRKQKHQHPLYALSVPTPSMTALPI